MKKISPTVQLSEAIKVLEADHAIKGQILKDQFLVTYESLKPINLIKSTLKEIATSPIIGENVLGSIMGLASGYLSKKIVVGGSANPFRKLFGSLLQMGVASTVAKHPEIIRMFGQYIAQFIRHRNEVNTEEL